jgi:hypothetical protein
MQDEHSRDRGERSTTVSQTPAAALERRDDVRRSPRLPDFVIAAGTQFERWRFWVPYGRWTCADGREVLFNRDYTPIYERHPSQLGRVAQHDEWVPWVAQEWFFNDGTSPVSYGHIPLWQWQPVVSRINDLLVRWALPPLLPPPRKRTSARLHAQRGCPPALSRACLRRDQEERQDHARRHHHAGDDPALRRPLRRGHLRRQ